MSLPFALVDAFTEQPYAGNTAGVVPVADGLSAIQMQRIARELGQTETCFVSAVAEPGADLRVRWFTPKVEVDLCGHATVGAFVLLAADGRIDWRGDTARVRCATRSGAIEVELARTPSGAPRAMLSVGVAALASATLAPAAVAAAIGLPASALDPALPLALEPAGARVIVPVARLDDLLALTPNGPGMVAYGEETGVRRFTLLCRETERPEHFAHLRHFAPANGIPEDPVTGTAHAVAAVYFDRLGLLPPGERVVLTGEQGRAVDRRGVVTVDARRRDGRMVAVWIGGGGVIVARGTLEPPR
ncbi:MAG TPA: PhzF family phenazine biosynthesis protein [Thermomicrobiales bacterium]|nr:PhzF family phenazine biosynthesis protein [Thermomicrobiales bacterium]